MKAYIVKKQDGGFVVMYIESDEVGVNKAVCRWGYSRTADEAKAVAISVLPSQKAEIANAPLEAY